MGDLDCQLVVEAVPEHLDLKKRSSPRSTASSPGRDPRDQHLLAAGHRDRGGHEQPQARRRHALLQPRPVLQFVEVVRTVVTEDEVFEDVKALAQRLGSSPSSSGTRPASSPTRCCSATSTTPCRCSRASTPRARTSTPPCTSRCGYPMGPLALMDLIGLDTAYEILDTMYKQGRDRLHAPTPIIKRGQRRTEGRKSAAAYTYAEEGSSAVVADHPTPAPGRRVHSRDLPDQQGGCRRLGHHGHRDHRGVRQGRLRRRLRRAGRLRSSRSPRGRRQEPREGRPARVP